MSSDLIQECVVGGKLKGRERLVNSLFNIVGPIAESTNSKVSSYALAQHIWMKITRAPAIPLTHQ